MLEYGSTLSKILGNTLGFLIALGLIMALLEHIFPEWFRKHIKRK